MVSSSSASSSHAIESSSTFCGFRSKRGPRDAADRRENRIVSDTTAPGHRHSQQTPPLLRRSCELRQGVYGGAAGTVLTRWGDVRQVYVYFRHQRRSPGEGNIYSARSRLAGVL